jgi:hypothetical protein
LLPLARAEKLEHNLTPDAFNVHTPQSCAYHSPTGQVIFGLASEAETRARLHKSLAEMFALETHFLHPGGVGGPVAGLGSKAWAGSIRDTTGSVILGGAVWFHGEYLVTLSAIHHASSLAESTAQTTAVAREIESRLP